MRGSKVKRVTLILALTVVAGVAVLTARLVFFPPAPSFLKADAIVLLAGDMDGRAPTAARVFLDGEAKTMILTNDGVLSGWSDRYQRNLYQIEWTAEKLAALGVPLNAMVELPYYGSSTAHDALAAQRYLRTTREKRIILVTSDYHAWRALWTFNKVFRAEGTSFSVISARSSDLTIQKYLLEAAKICYYWIRYDLLGFFPKIGGPPLKMTGAAL